MKMILLSIFGIICLIIIIKIIHYRGSNEYFLSKLMNKSHRNSKKSTFSNSQKNNVTEVMIIDDIRKHIGYPPKMEMFIEDVAKNEDTNWDYSVFIYEVSEQYLGTDQFNSLEKRFSLIPGIEKVKHEDREF